MADTPGLSNDRRAEIERRWFDGWDPRPTGFDHCDVRDLLDSHDELSAELAKAKRACQTLGKVVDRQAIDICRITGVPMPESGDADFERAWSVAFEMADEIKRLRAQVAALTSALERTEANFRAAVRSLPVRDMAENLAENRAALASGDGVQP